MAIGRPIELTPNIATKNISSLATADQTQFTVTGGYRINEIAVYRNGVRLAEGRDFTASDGDTVNLVTAATVDDVIEFAVFDSFNVSDAIVSAASSQNLNGDFNVTGSLYAGNFEPSQLIVGVVTASTALHVGSALTANAAGDVESIGIITAASFKGDGSGLTGIGETLNVRTNTITVSGVSTFTGAVNVDATTDSTSTTTGALIVDGGLGVAKNVYIGAGLSVAGTLTYEDVTSVDSVGMVTAKSGVNVSGGQLQVGVAYSVGAAGVATAAGFVGGTIAGSTGTFTGDVDIADKIVHTGDTNTAIRFPSADTITAETGGTERLRVDSSGRLLIGSTSSLTQYGAQSHLQVAGTGYDGSTIALRRDQNNANPPGIVFAKSRAGSLGGNTIVQDDDQVGSLVFAAADGSDLTSISAQIKVEIDGTPGSDDTPGRIVFETTADGANSATERMRLTSEGRLAIGSNQAHGTLVSRSADDTKQLIVQNSTSESGTFDNETGIWFKGQQSQDDERAKAAIIHLCTADYGVGDLVVCVDAAADNGNATIADNEKLRITSAGKCGIGTTNPQQLLHIEPVSGDSYVQIDTNGNGGILLDVQGTQRSVFANDSAFSGNLINTAIGAKNDLRIRTGGSYTQRLIIGEAGISTFSATPHDDKGSLRDIPLRSVTGSAATLVAADAGKVVSTNTTGWTVPGSTFDEGDTVTLLNNSAGGLVITCSAVTTYLTSDGTTVTSSTLGARGLATLYFVSSSVAYLQGTALS